MPVHVFEKLPDESPISAAESVEITAGPLTATTLLTGIDTTDLMVYANPLTSNSELFGQVVIGTVTEITAGALTATLSLTGSFDASNSEVDPLESFATLSGRCRIKSAEEFPDVQVEIRDGTTLKWVITTKLENLQWGFMRLGGCDIATLSILDPPNGMNETTVQGYDIQIKVDPGPGMSVWWRGYIDDARRSLGEPFRMDLSAVGWGRRLNHIAVVGLGFSEEDGGIFFENMDAAAIARSLIDQAIAQGLTITYTRASAPDSGFIIEYIQFNGSMFSALQTLAELAGEAEWGVDRNKEFYFITRNFSVDRVFLTGKDIQDLQHSYSIQGLINRIYLFGDSGYRAVIEDTDDLITDVNQATDTTTLAFGKSTSNQRIIQTFTTTKTTLSRVDLKLAKTGWGSELVTDGDMELNDGAAPPNWNKLWGATKREKVGNAHGGSRRLKISHTMTGPRFYGIYQDVTVTANQEVTFSAWLQDPDREEPITVQLVNGSATPYTNGNELLATLKNTERNTTWYRQIANIIPTTTTLGIRIFTTNKKPRPQPFYVDDISVLPAADVIVSIVKRTGTSPVTFDEDTPLATAVINFEDIPTTAAVIQTSITASPLSASETYGIMINSGGTPSDSQYFTLSYTTEGSGLYKDDGTGWTTVTGSAYHITYLPLSQSTWGVRSEVIRQPYIGNDEDAALWGKALLATKGTPVERAAVILKPNKNILIEESIPVALVKIATGN